MSVVSELVKAAGMTAPILADADQRAEAIDEFNARAGGVREILQGRSPTAVAPVPIEISRSLSPQDRAACLRRIARGRCAWTVFAAGRATRMRLPVEFDRLGIAGLTRRILQTLPDDDAVMPSVDRAMRTLIEQAAVGRPESADDLSILQRQVCQLQYQLAHLIRSTPGAGADVRDALQAAVLVLVVNESNREALANQLHAIRFGGLDPQNVYLVQQPEVGGEQVLPNGTLRPYDRQRWPEGHGRPMIDMACSVAGVWHLADGNRMIDLRRPVVHELKDKGIEHTVFAQVNDLHLMDDMAALPRWKVAWDIMRDTGSLMVMEMVANQIREKLADGRTVRQKGGAIFVSRDGFITMRDTVALKPPDLQAHARPELLSRMFYIIDLNGIARLTDDSLPAYLTERRTSDGRVVLTREMYSGDASSRLKGTIVKQEGFQLSTFKMRSRLGAALDAIQRQDRQPDFPPPCAANR